MGEVFGNSYGEGHSIIVGQASGGVDQIGGGVNSGKFPGFRVVAGERAQQVPGSASHIENTLRCGVGGYRQCGGAVTDGVVQSTTPTLVVVLGTIVVCGDIAIGRHSGNCKFGRRYAP